MSLVRLRGLALAFVAIVVMAACGGATSGNDIAAEPAPATTTEAESAASAEEPASDSPLSGEFTTVGGETIDLADFQGQDVVLWFWAPW